MASPSEEIRSREAVQEKQGLPAVAQASHEAAYDLYRGQDDPTYGWGRFPPQGKRATYGGSEQGDSKSRTGRSAGRHAKQ